MPQVRWKTLLMMAVTATSLIRAAVSGIPVPVSDAISMASDGWRPIIGTSPRESQHNGEITQYRNPIETGEGGSIKIRTIAPQSVTPTTSTSSTLPAKLTHPTVSVASNNENYKGSTAAFGTHVKPFQHLVLVSGHGPHIPLTPTSHRNVAHSRHPGINKSYAHFILNNKRIVKPMRGTSHSLKNEIFSAAASSGIGSYAFFNPSYNVVKTAIPPNGKLYHVSQPHTHMEFSNHFNFPGVGSDGHFQRGIPTGSSGPNLNPSNFFGHNRNPSFGDFQLFSNQNDYTRHLVPPPFKSHLNKPKLQDQPLFIQEDHTMPNHLTTVNGEPLFIKNHKQESELPQKTVEVQVTKEKLNTFHNSIPTTYKTPDTVSYSSFQNIRNSFPSNTDYFDNPGYLKSAEELKPGQSQSIPNFEKGSNPFNRPTYEVTEGKEWYNGFQPLPSIKQPHVDESHQGRHQPDEKIKQPFLPTPYRPNNSLPPTSPTQQEISSVYAKLNAKNKKLHYETFDLQNFNPKEVSTHYPILGRPESPVFTLPPYNSYSDISNEITTQEEKSSDATIPHLISEENTTTLPPTNSIKQPVRGWQSQRKRVNPKRQRPQHQRISTERPQEQIRDEYDEHTTESTTVAHQSKRYRTKRPTSERDTTRSSLRYRPRADAEEKPHPTQSLTRPNFQSAEESINVETKHTHRGNTQEVQLDALEDQRYITSASADKNTVHRRPLGQATYLNNKYDLTKNDQLKDQTYFGDTSESLKKVYETHKPLSTLSPYEEISTTAQNDYTTIQPDHTEIHNFIEEATTQITTVNFGTKHLHVVEDPITEKEILPDINNNYKPHISSDIFRNSINKEISDINLENTESSVTVASSPVTTTTEEATTIKSHRIRTRPIKYDRNRPRFSVKEYRQRLSQYVATTTEATRASTESPRIRFPNRKRKPITYSINNQEDEEKPRSKFIPKEPRHGLANETFPGSVITEKSIKAVNTRLRPFGRHRSTTEASSTTHKVSIKPNIFSNLRRPPPINLRTRIQNKYNRTTTTTTAPIETTSEPDDTYENTPFYGDKAYSKTADNIKSKLDDGYNYEKNDGENDEQQLDDSIKNASFIHSQRVSDLTSSVKNEYDRPGSFKTVLPTSRQVPNYFTIATDDPILPIEAFFHNIKDTKIK